MTYYFDNSGTSSGPLSKEELSGKISKNTLVWYEGQQDWIKASEVDDLKDLFIQIPPPIPKRTGKVSYLSYLKAKQKVIITWLIIHCFALFVNIFSLQGKVEHGSSWSYILTATDVNDKFDHSEPSSFWPFVKFIEKRVRGISVTDGYYYWGTGFNGVFYQYGYSEFLAYTVLILVFLYFRWYAQNSVSKNT